MEIERKEEKTKIKVLFDLMKSKVDRENGIGLYFKNMAIFGGIGLATGLSTLSTSIHENNFAGLALSTVLAGSGMLVGIIKKMIEEKTQLHSVMDEVVRDISTRKNLLPIEKVILERYVTKKDITLSEIVKDNLIRTDLDLESLNKMNVSEIKSLIKESNAKFSTEEISENVKYRMEYLPELKHEIRARIERVSDYQAKIENRENKEAIVRKRLSM